MAYHDKIIANNTTSVPIHYIRLETIGLNDN